MARGRAGAPDGPVAEADHRSLGAGWSDWTEAVLERLLVLRQVDVSGDAIEAADRAVAIGEAALKDALGIDGPLRTIADTAELDAVDVGAFALCAAVELDQGLQQLVGALGRPPPPHRISLQLLGELLGPEAVAAMSENGRLARAALVVVEPGVPFAQARISVPRKVAWALIGDLSLDRDLPPDAEYVFAPDDVLGEARLVLVHGPDRVRRLQAATTATLGLAFVASPEPADDEGWRAVVRQATVAGTGLIIELAEPLSPLGRRWLSRADHLAVALCSDSPLPLDSLPEQAFLEVEADEPSVRDDEWDATFEGAPRPARRPTAEQLLQARLAAAGGTDPGDALRRVTSGALLRHATRIVPRVGWDDLVLPPAQQRQLRALVDRYQQRSTVHDEWGLSLYPSPGVVALFSGPSGTGKTTSAEAIAHELGVDMFRVDLAALVSKYIGETEKNLEAIFSAAHTGNYLLLFDEADSLFGSRSKVEDSKDRYANLEVSYLLQRLETYDGLVVLTSNFQGNIDPAFLRRIHLTVHFPVPGADDRRRIWERSLGAAPTAGLELDFVAEQFDLTGGSIRNAALSAAFAAAAQDRPIGMVVLLQAIAQELTKLAGGRTTPSSAGGSARSAARPSDAWKGSCPSFPVLPRAAPIVPTIVKKSHCSGA